MKRYVLFFVGILAVIFTLMLIPGFDLMAYAGDLISNPNAQGLSFAVVAVGMEPSAEQRLFEKISERIKKEAGTHTEDLRRQQDDLQKQVDAMNAVLDQKRYTNNMDKNNQFVSDVFKAMEQAAPGVKQSGKSIIEFETKSGALSMGLTTTTGDGVVIGDREPGIHSEPKRRPFILQNIATGTTESDSVTWIERTDEEGKPAYRREFETHPKRSWGTVERKAYVKKISVTAEYSREILEDLQGFRDEVSRDLLELSTLVLDEEILRGTEGAKDDAGMKGLIEYAQAWNNGALVVASPSIYDVVSVGLTQIEKEHHMPSVVIMSPDTFLRMKLTKDKDGNYINSYPANVRFIQNTLLNNGEILIIDGMKAKYLFRRNWTLEMTDSHEDNFTKDVILMKLTGRGVLRVKNTDAKAFVYISDVDTALQALAGS